MTVVYDIVASPVGALLLTAEEAGLTSVRFEAGRHLPAARDWRRADGARGEAARILAEACAQLAAYFAGERRTFDLPLAARGTPFEERVWEELRAIPFGRTTSYGEIARLLGDPRAARAVGTANGRNPLAIVVPCHRVIGADGSLVGFGGGVPRKRWLLEHEGALRAPDAVQLTL
jgi:methylated-DNA-[protein]-cysteine S-methyltransferase